MSNTGQARVNALVRGLKVLAALNDLNDASVGDLVRATGVAKTTVLRILATLADEGYVRRDHADMYRVTDRVAELSRGLIGFDRRAQTVQPILDALADLRWPVELLTRDDVTMVTTLDNRLRAPIKLTPLERRRFPLLESAAGAAFLSALPARKRGDLMRRAAANLPDPDASLRKARKALREAEGRGYALRSLDTMAAGLRAAAVPVGTSDPRGALVLLYFNDMVSADQFRRRLLPHLRRAAKDIDRALARLG